MLQPSRTYPSFSQPVRPGGYCWWYADGVSDDGLHAITLIAFIGSVFSPYYYRAKKKSNADPLNYCSLNVALYSKNGGRWCMTERTRARVSVDESHLQIGPSAVSWSGNELTFDIDERAMPVPQRLSGQVQLTLPAFTQGAFSLDKDGHHHWWPAGANAQIEVRLNNPAAKWHGSGYADMNWGARALERDMQYWCWSRFQHQQKTYINYDVYAGPGRPPAVPDTAIAIAIDERGRIEAGDHSTPRQLPSTRWWRMPRHASLAATHVKPGIKTLEDTPFYSRSLIDVQCHGEPVTGVHESVSLTRFKNPLVQAMLPFRMPRQIFTGQGSPGGAAD